MKLDSINKPGGAVGNMKKGLPFTTSAKLPTFLHGIQLIYITLTPVLLANFLPPNVIVEDPYSNAVNSCVKAITLECILCDYCQKHVVEREERERMPN